MVGRDVTSLVLAEERLERARIEQSQLAASELAAQEASRLKCVFSFLLSIFSSLS
jgi:hypothetical protein